jgi:hypothetical protein
VAIPTNFASTLSLGQTPGSGSNREDFADWIVNVDRTDTPLMSSIGTTEATGVRHDWSNEVLRNPKTFSGFVAGTSMVTGRNEGEDFNADALTYPTRKSSYPQIFETFFGLTRTQITIARKGGTAGIKDLAGKESKKVMVELMRAVEARHFSTKSAAGVATGAIRLEKTLDDSTATTGMLVDNGPTGANLGYGSNVLAKANPTEADFLTILRSCNEAGVKVTDIHLSLARKQWVSQNFVGFGSAAAPLVRNIPGVVDANTVVATFDYYKTDAGTARLVGNIWVTKANEVVSSTDTADPNSGRIWFLQRDMIKMAWLDNFQTNLIGKRGDSLAFQVVGEGCLEVRTDRMGKITNVVDL